MFCVIFNTTQHVLKVTRVKKITQNNVLKLKILFFWMTKVNKCCNNIVYYYSVAITVYKTWPYRKVL